MPRAVALLSGGLDSTLAARIVQRAGLEVEGLNVRTPFHCSAAGAVQAAAQLGIRLTLRAVGEHYLDVLRRPLYGYGKGANPCVDCRIVMGRMARELMEACGACVVVSGEILGQRPMSQKRKDLAIVAGRSGLEGRLLRPLCARLLPPTVVEQQRLVDREQLYAFSGRSRRALIQLARKLGLAPLPAPSPGCALAEASFAPRVFDLLEHCPQATLWDCELLGVGRHVRIDGTAKAIVGRNAAQNAALRRWFHRPEAHAAALLHPENFPGPEVLLVGRIDEETIRQAATLMLRYTRKAPSETASIVVRTPRTTQTRSFPVAPAPENVK